MRGKLSTFSPVYIVAPQALYEEVLEYRSRVFGCPGGDGDNFREIFGKIEIKNLPNGKFF